MKTAFWLATILGFGGVLAAAHLVPWVEHTRLPSKTSVVANGGRAEQFLIRLPADRIAVTDGQQGGIRAAGAVGALVLPAKLMAETLLVEHFKIRDSAGNVIGLAARHWSQHDRGTSTAWSVLIPSRGALLLTAPGEARGALDTALQAAGYNRGAAWSGEVKVPLTASREAAGIVAAGSEEFEALGGTYAEIWTVTGVGESGELRGTIELNTITNRGS
jgi:hypothetical protein